MENLQKQFVTYENFYQNHEDAEFVKSSFFLWRTS